MLPILRILPVGGVLLAILILVLALTPPGGAHAPLVPTMVMARGPLLDRDEHPEWRQFLIRAALRRADELSRLRELPDTPMRIEPVAPAPGKPVSSASATPANMPPDNASAASAEQAPQVVAGLPSDRNGVDPDPGNVTGSINETPGATVPVDIGVSRLRETPHTPRRIEPAALASSKPVSSASATPMNMPPDKASTASAEQAPQVVAGLPSDRNGAYPDPDSVTGTINESPGATIPVDIGERSSTELPVVLPEEKPQVVRTPARVKAPHESRHRHVHRVHHAKAQAKPQQAPSEVNFFKLLFGIWLNPRPAAVNATKGALKTPPASTPVVRIRPQMFQANTF